MSARVEYQIPLSVANEERELRNVLRRLFMIGGFALVVAASGRAVKQVADENHADLAANGWVT